MGLRALRFVTLLLAALALTMESAHLLELPQTMQYGADLYSAVNTTLYRYFAVVGNAAGGRPGGSPEVRPLRAAPRRVRATLVTRRWASPRAVAPALRAPSETG